MKKIMDFKKYIIVFLSVLFLMTGGLMGCGDQKQEQTAAERNKETSGEQTTVDQNRSATTPQTQPEHLVGKQGVSNDGRVLGKVTGLQSTGEDFSYMIIKGEGDRLHAVPTNRLKASIQKDRLAAGFDQRTFQNSPSFTEAERQQYSGEKLNEVRGYYESNSQVNQQNATGKLQNETPKKNKD